MPRDEDDDINDDDDCFRGDIPKRPWPWGKIQMLWSAAISATYRFSESGDRWTCSKVDELQLLCWGSSIWDVVGVSVDSGLDLEKSDSHVEQSCSGGGHGRLTETGVIWVGSGPQPKKVTETTDTEWKYSRSEHAPIAAPYRGISLGGWYQICPGRRVRCSAVKWPLTCDDGYGKAIDSPVELGLSPTNYLQKENQCPPDKHRHGNVRLHELLQVIQSP